MKLVFVIVTLCRGGAQRMLVEITNGMVQRGHDVTILMPAKGVVEFPNVKAQVVTLPRTEIKPEDYPPADFLVSNFYTTVPVTQAASELGRGMHVRLALCYEPTFLPESQPSFLSYHATDKLLVLSQWQQQIAYLNHGVRAKIVPVGVSPEFRNLHLRRKNDPLTIAAVMRMAEGNWSWHRDQDFLVGQLEQVGARHSDVQFLLICPPTEFEKSAKLKKLAGRGVCSRIFGRKQFRVETPRDDVELNRLYNAADIYVSASVYDAGSLPGLEAMHCGAALATTFAGGNIDYCKHEVNCLMSYRFEGTLGHNIERLVDDAGLRRRLAEEGEREASRWTWQRSVMAFEEALQEYAKTGGKSARRPHFSVAGTAAGRGSQGGLLARLRNRFSPV